MLILALLENEVVARAAGAAAFALYDVTTWQPYHYVIWSVVIVGALELLTRLVLAAAYCVKSKPIPMTGKHLDEFTNKDWAFIWINRLVTIVFSYQLINFCWYSSRIRWAWADLNIWNSVVALPLAYILFDVFYCAFHRLLHVKWLYGYIHKHHHRQMAPSRGQLDAINIHICEMIPGEYNHWWCIYLISHHIFPRQGMHISAIIVFILLGGILASFNHTRFDLKFPIFNCVYQVKYHDVHHWFPNSNYGQYTMLVDYIFGSFKDHPLNLQAKDGVTAAVAISTAASDSVAPSNGSGDDDITSQQASTASHTNAVKTKTASGKKSNKSKHAD